MKNYRLQYKLDQKQWEDICTVEGLNNAKSEIEHQCAFFKEEPSSYRIVDLNGQKLKALSITANGIKNQQTVKSWEENNWLSVGCLVLFAIGDCKREDYDCIEYLLAFDSADLFLRVNSDGSFEQEIQEW